MHSVNLNSSSAMDVELAPQAQLLSRIQYLINNHSQFNFLHGGAGVGKSFVVAMLSERLSNHLIIEVKCRAKFDQQAFYQNLICELATDDLTDLDQSVGDAIQGAITHYQQSVLIVFDNAQFLSREVIGKLWHSFNQAVVSSGANHKVNMLLIGGTQWASPLVRHLKDAQPKLVESFELPYLSIAQGLDFLTVVHPDWTEKQRNDYVNSLKKQQLTPKNLIYVAEPNDGNLKLKIILIASVCLVAFAIASVSLWSIYQEPQSANSAVNQPPQLITLPPIIAVPPVPEVLEVTEVTEAAKVAPQKLVDESVLTAATEDTQDLVLAQPNKVVSAEKRVIEPPLSPEITNEALASIYIFDEEQLLNVPSTNYSLMLGGFSQPAVLEQVIQGIENKSDIYVYQTIRNDKDWFVLLYGKFSSKDDANRLMSSAPPVLAIFSPWIKSFTAIQSEITMVNTIKMDKNN